MDELLRALRPLKHKMLLQKFIVISVWMLIAGLCAAISFTFLSKIVWIRPLYVYITICPVLSLILAVVISALQMPRPSMVCAAGDGLGFQERFSTAYELTQKADKNLYYKALMEDALYYAKSANFKKLYKLSVPWKNLVVCGVLCIVLALAYVIPGPNAEEFIERGLMRAAIDDEIKAVTEKTKEVSLELTQKDAKELQNKVKELLKEPKKSTNAAEAAKALQMAQAELKKASLDSVSKDLKKIGEALSALPATQTLGEKITSGDIGSIRKEIESMIEKLQNMTDEEISGLADAFVQAAAELSDNPELANTLNELGGQLGEALSSGNFSDTINSFSGLDNQLSAMAAQNEQLRNALDQVSEAMAQSARNMGGESRQGSQNSGESQIGQSGGETQGGQGGNEAQTGQNGMQAGQSGIQAGGSGQGSGSIENNPVYDRPGESLGDYETNISGIQGESGEMSESLRKGLGRQGESRPYSEVFNQYKTDALNNLSDYEIPDGMKEIVKQYFSILN